ncbi:hypothetical protein M885DRAFT_493679 [Pelagophyceae sp. CCMP2097]|nr:hypothetical protein M885DRAFT_493679 [Pelagophyceae sp. CCMP2097]
MSTVRRRPKGWYRSNRSRGLRVNPAPEPPGRPVTAAAENRDRAKETAAAPHEFVERRDAKELTEAEIKAEISAEAKAVMVRVRDIHRGAVDSGEEADVAAAKRNTEAALRASAKRNEELASALTIAAARATGGEASTGLDGLIRSSTVLSTVVEQPTAFRVDGPERTVFSKTVRIGSE